MVGTIQRKIENDIKWQNMYDHIFKKKYRCSVLEAQHHVLSSYVLRFLFFFFFSRYDSPKEHQDTGKHNAKTDLNKAKNKTAKQVQKLNI